MSTVSEPPLDWPEEQWPEERTTTRSAAPVEQAAPYRRGATVRQREELTPDEIRRIAERRARHAAEDRAAEDRAAVTAPANPTRRRLSPLAITAFVTAFVIPFVGLLLGIIGTARLGRGSKTYGRGLFIVAIVISLFALYVFALLL
jgi:hypothetical protein